MKRLISFAAIFVVLPNIAFASDTEDLVALLEGVKSLDTRFEQVILDRDGSRIQTSSGEMQVKRPRQFRWHAEEPFEQLVVSNGELVWVYDIDLEQVLERPLGNEVGETPALLLSGDSSNIAKEFDVKRLPGLSSEVSYQLIPKSNEQLFDMLEISFIGEKPSAMRLEDSLGQKTSFEFIQPKVNKKLADTLFEFEVPEDVDLIRHDD